MLGALPARSTQARAICSPPSIGLSSALTRPPPSAIAVASGSSRPIFIGYNPAGGSVSLDAARVPDRPVLLVEVDTAKALPLGVDIVRQRLPRGHLQPKAT